MSSAPKRKRPPALAIASRGQTLAAALVNQTFSDLRIVADADRALKHDHLALLDGPPARWLLVSLDDAALARALSRDPFLLEKTVRMLECADPRVVMMACWANPDRAYPGHLLPEDQRFDGLSAAGFVVALKSIGELGAIPISGGTLFERLWGWARAVGPGAARVWVIGSGTASGPGVPAAVTAPSARIRPEDTSLPLILGQGLRELARRLIGPERADRIWQKLPLRRLPQRWSLSSIDAPPLYRPLPQESGRGLLIFVPWLISGGADRSVLDLIEGLAEREPTLRIYLCATLPFRYHWGPQTWADRLLPLLRGWFSLPDLSNGPPGQTATSLCERLDIDSVLVMNSGEGYDSLSRLSRLARPPRRVALVHAFGIDEVTGKRHGWALEAATRYADSIDGYAVTSRILRDALMTDYQVPAEKMRIIPLSTQVARFAAARRPRLVPGEIPTILWLGRLSPEKNPLTVLDVARLWRDRHPGKPIRFVIAGGGGMDKEVRDRWHKLELEDSVALLGEISDTPAQLRAADCIMVTSLTEGIPVVLYEAMAADLPIITIHKNSSIPDDFSREQAYYIDEATDASQYVAALEHILAHPDEARATSARNYERRHEFDRARYVERMHALLFPSD